jgi:hypothetical protein
MPPDRLAQPTVPLRVQAEDLAITMHRENQNVVPMSRYGTPAPGVPTRAPTNAPSHPTLPMPAATPMSPMAASMQSFTPSSSSQHGLSTSHASALGMRPHTPSVTPPSSPQYPVLSSSTHSQPSYSHLANQHEPRRSRALIVLIPACIVGVVLGIVLAVGGDKTKPTEESANTVALTPGRAEGNRAANGTPTDKPRDTRSGEGSQATPTDIKPAGTQPVDTQPAGTQPADTKPADIKPVDPKPVDPKPVDTKPVDAKPVDKKPIDKKPKEPVTSSSVKDDDVAALFKANKFADVVAQCAASTKIVALNSTACTLAACKTKETAKAKKWFASVGSAKRASVVRDCNGVLPAEKPSDDELCRRNPLACQH